MPTRGRPSRGYDASAILLRVPTDLLQRIETYQARIEAQIGLPVTRQALLVRLLTQAIDAIERPASPALSAETVRNERPSENGNMGVQEGYPPELKQYQKMVQATIAGAKDIFKDPPIQTLPPPAVQHPHTLPARTRTAPAPRGLPRETLEAIAQERTHCEGLSLSEFAQRLHDKGIYSATAKNGSRGPVNKGNLAKWLERAREAGLL